jgi:hypothetical protein
MLGCDFVDDGFVYGDIVYLSGGQDTITDDMLFTFTLEPGPHYRPDELAATQGRVLFASQDTVARVIAYQHPDEHYRVITSSIIFGALMDGDAPNLKEELMRRYMNFFLNGQSAIVSRTDHVLPEHVLLYPCYPNPFNTSTTIEFDVAQANDFLQVSVYNVLGQKIKKLFAGPAEQGRHRVKWDGTTEDGMTVDSGVYVCQLQGREQSMLVKLMFIK